MLDVVASLIASFGRGRPAPAPLSIIECGFASCFSPLFASRHCIVLFLRTHAWFQVVFECLGGALLSFVGVLMWGTSLAPIDITHASRDKYAHPASDAVLLTQTPCRTIDTWEKRPSSFRVFAHRGAAL